MQNCNGNATAPFHDSWFVSIKLDWTVFSYTFCQSEQNSKVLNNYPRLFYHFSYYLVPSSIYESVALTVIEESDKMSLASKLASNVIKKAPSGPVRISYRRFINLGSSQMMSVFQLLLPNKAPLIVYTERQFVVIHNIDFCSWILAVLSLKVYIVYVKGVNFQNFLEHPNKLFCPFCFVRALGV